MSDGTVIVYTTDPCSFCARVKGMLKTRGVDYAEVNLSKDPSGRLELVQRTGMMSFPQIVVGERLVGGFNELLAAAEQDGRLDELLPPRRPLSSRVARAPGLAVLAHVGPAPGRRRSSRSSLPQRTHGSPARRCTRNRSWKEPRTPSTWRKSSMLAPRASMPACSAAITPRAAPRTAPRVSARPAAAGGCRAMNSASSA